jgi:serine/threonine-protein kinase
VAPETRIGTEIAGYRIVAVLGRGGQSTVYLATHKTLGRTGALKLLSPELAALPGYRERFVRESQSVAAIHHPNIIHIYDAGEADGLLYIAMQYVEGATLEEELEKGPLPLGRAMYIIEQVASALDAAHSRGLVHRDVKPANVVIAQHTDHVFLTDFGIAKTTTSGGLTEAGAFIGTIDYAAPEQIEGRPVDARTDVYALGCVLYACLTGMPPYARVRDYSVMQAKLIEPPPRATSVRPELPPQLDDVFSRAMAIPMDDRFDSCGELVTAARAACLGTRPALPPIEQRAQHTRVSTGQPTVTTPAVPPGAAGGPGAPRRKVRIGGLELDRRWMWIAAAALALALAAIAGSAIVSDDEPTASGGHDAMTQGHDAITQELLLAHVPESTRDSCETAAVPDIDVFIRSVTCDNGLGGTVRYSRAHNGNSLRQYFLSRLELFVNLPFPTREHCDMAERASGEWVRDDVVGHHEERSKTAQGRVACYLEGDHASLIWTDTPTKIFASSSAPAADRKELLAWWATDAGPGTGLSHESHELGPYPDAIERELLVDHIPDEIENCERGANPDHQIFLRTVSCDQPDGAGKVLYSYAHSGQALRQYFAGRVTGEGYTLADPSNCMAEGTGVGSWTSAGAMKRETTGSAAGQQLCFKREGNAHIEWFDVAQVIYASASRPADHARALYDWWESAAGPVEHGHEEEPGAHGDSDEEGDSGMTETGHSEEHG